MTEETTNPVADDDVRVVESEGVTDDQAEAPDTDAEDSDEEQPEAEDEDDELEEVERNGKTYKVPKALKAELLMQADYTRKTQDLAQERKALAEAQARGSEDDQNVLKAKAATLAMDERIAAIEKLTPADWARIDAEDARNGTAKGRQLDRELLHLRTKRDQVQREVQNYTERRELAAQQDFAKQREEFVETLKRDIGLNPDLNEKLTAFAEKQGVTAAELALLTDPRMGKLLHLAWQGQQAIDKQMAALRAAKASKVQPAVKVAGKGAPAPGLRDDVSAEEWVRRRNEQLRRK